MFHIISGKRKQHSHVLLLQYRKANLTKLTLPVKYLNHAVIANHRHMQIAICSFAMLQ